MNIKKIEVIYNPCKATADPLCIVPQLAVKMTTDAGMFGKYIDAVYDDGTPLDMADLVAVINLFLEMLVNTDNGTDDRGLLTDTETRLIRMVEEEVKNGL